MNGKKERKKEREAEIVLCKMERKEMRKKATKEDQ